MDMESVEKLESTEKGESEVKMNVEDRLSVGRLDFGCKHYRRRCRIRAPCCNEIFGCRRCHYEAKDTNEVDSSKLRDNPRQLVEKVICSLCDHEQDAKQDCENCDVCMGDYFCVRCKFFDDETVKERYHCDDCGICRIGGRENFFHCSCYSNALRNDHPCD